jgi:hypothetical protein
LYHKSQIMYKKITFLLLFPFIAHFIISCCDCVEPLIYHFTHKTITINNLDNAGSEPAVSTATSIIKAAYGIRIQVDREKTACTGPARSLFIESAYATKCNCPPEMRLMPKDSITAIKVFTLNDFDSNHLANAEISDYFRVYTPHSFLAITTYLQASKNVLYNESDLGIKIDLLLMTTPAMNTQHKFKVQITLSDGRIFEPETSIELI